MPQGVNEIRVKPGGQALLDVIELRGYPLTAREEQILQFSSDDMNGKTIAARLRISYHCVKYFRHRIMCKLGKNTMEGAIADALRRGIIK